VLREDAAIKAAGIDPMTLPKDTEELLGRFPNASVNADEQRRLRCVAGRGGLVMLRVPLFAVLSASMGGSIHRPVYARQTGVSGAVGSPSRHAQRQGRDLNARYADPWHKSQSHDRDRGGGAK